MYTPPQPYYNAHPQFPYPVGQYPSQATFASPDVHVQHRSSLSPASYSQYTYARSPPSDVQATQGVTSSSLACALDERATGGNGAFPTQNFPDSEVVPYAPSPAASTADGRDSLADYYSIDAKVVGHDETFHSPFVGVLNEGESSNYDEQSAVSSYGSTADSPNTEYEADTEVGYFNGEMVPLGLVGDDYASDDYSMNNPAVSDNSHDVLEPPDASTLSLLTEHPPFLRNSRSYTLAEAITPIEEQRPRLGRSQNKIPDASSVLTRSVGTDAGASSSMWQPDPSGGPDHACVTSASTPSPPSQLSPPGNPRAKSPAKVQQGSVRSGPSTKAKTSSTRAADDIHSEPTGRPGESVIKLAVNVPREPKKKPIMACLFCRERKIACGHPAPADEDRRCNQCRRRDLECVFPKECRRGQHKRISRLARVNAHLNGEALPSDQVMVLHAQSPHLSVSPAPAVVQSPGPSDARERRKSSSKTSKADADAERHVARLQHQIASMQQQRLGQR